MTRSFPITSGAALRCKGWRQEGLLRLLENVLAVGEDPENLVVYAALGRAARDWPSHDRIVATLKTMNDGETLIVQSGKPIGLIKTHAKAPVVLMANCNIVGQWANAETFYELEKKNLICWGGLTAGDWQYIGSQGVIQGTYEIFMRIAERHFGGDLAGRFVLTAGLGGMGGAQPLAGTMAKAAILCIEVDPARIAKRIETGYLDAEAETLDAALAMIEQRARCAAARFPSASAAMPPMFIRRSFGAASSRTSSPTRPPRTTSSMATCPRACRSTRFARCATSDPQRSDGGKPPLDRPSRRRHAGLPEGRRRGLRQRQSHPHPGQRPPASPMPSTSRSSPRRFCGRCLRAPSGRSAGWRCRTIPTTSARSTICCWSASATTTSSTNWIKLARVPCAVPGLAGAHRLARPRRAHRARPRGQPHGARRNAGRPRSPSRAIISTPAPWRIRTS